MSETTYGDVITSGSFLTGSADEHNSRKTSGMRNLNTLARYIFNLFIFGLDLNLRVLTGSMSGQITRTLVIYSPPWLFHEKRAKWSRGEEMTGAEV